MDSICGANCNNCGYGKNNNCNGCRKSNIRCFGLVANMDFLLVSEYGANGENPEIILYKKR